MYRSTRYATSRGGRLVASSGASEALARVQDRVEHLPGAQLHHDEEEVLDVQVTGCAVDDSELQPGSLPLQLGCRYVGETGHGNTSTGRGLTRPLTASHGVLSQATTWCRTRLAPERHRQGACRPR